MIRIEDKTITLALTPQGPSITIYASGTVRLKGLHTFDNKKQAIEFFDAMSAELRK